MKRHAPAAERNRGPILDVLRTVVPATGTVLEIASGTGQHAVYFAAHLPGIIWQPSDASADALRSIAGWTEEARLANVRPALSIDAAGDGWPAIEAVGLFSANMVHIAPWSACEGLFRNAARLGCEWIFLYGPFVVPGEALAPSNAAFDASLKSQNRDWGLRRLDDVDGVAARNGFARDQTVSMPANNLVLVYRRRAESSQIS